MAIQLFGQNLTKINEAKGNKTKQKKKHTGLFFQHIFVN